MTHVVLSVIQSRALIAEAHELIRGAKRAQQEAHRTIARVREDVAQLRVATDECRRQSAEMMRPEEPLVSLQPPATEPKAVR